MTIEQIEKDERCNDMPSAHMMYVRKLVYLLVLSFIVQKFNVRMRFINLRFFCIGMLNTKAILMKLMLCMMALPKKVDFESSLNGLIL